MKFFQAMAVLMGISKNDDLCPSLHEVEIKKWQSAVGHIVEYQIAEVQAISVYERQDGKISKRTNFKYNTFVHRVERVEGTKIYFMGVSEPIDIAQVHPEIRCVR